MGQPPLNARPVVAAATGKEARAARQMSCWAGQLDSGPWLIPPKPYRTLQRQRQHPAHVCPVASITGSRMICRAVAQQQILVSSRADRHGSHARCAPPAACGCLPACTQQQPHTCSEMGQKKWRGAPASAAWLSRSRSGRGSTGADAAGGGQGHCAHGQLPTDCRGGCNASDVRPPRQHPISLRPSTHPWPSSSPWRGCWWRGRRACWPRQLARRPPP